MSKNKLKTKVPNKRSLLNHNKILFEQIKIIQSLPDKIVDGFLKSKGKLGHYNFSTKPLPNAE